MPSSLSSVLTSKTIGLWLIIFAIALLAMLLAAAIRIAFDAELPFLSQFFNLLEWGGTGGTVRNVVSDGIAPRIPQAIGAATKPEVAIEPPVSMAHADKRSSKEPANYEVR